MGIRGFVPRKQLALIVIFFSFYALANHNRLQDASRPTGNLSPELIDLTQVNFNERPDLRSLLPKLNSTFQILAKNLKKPRGVPVPDGESADGHHMLCSGSFVGSQRVVTATHCFTRYGEHSLPEGFILRRFQWEINEDGYLEKTGYADHRFSGTILDEGGDLRLMEIVPPVPEDKTLSPPSSSFELEEGLEFMALGYPSTEYAVPHVAVNCRLTDTDVTHGRGRMAPGYQSECRSEGGMSGGPQFLPDATQIGIVSQRTGETESVTGRLSNLLTTETTEFPSMRTEDGRRRK